MFFICLVVYIDSFLHYLIFDRFIHFWLFLQNSFYSLRFFPLFFRFYIHFYILFLFFISSDRYFLFFLKFCCIRVFNVCIDFLFSFLYIKWSTQHRKVSRDLSGEMGTLISFYLEIRVSPVGSSLLLLIAQPSSALLLIYLICNVILGLPGNPFPTALLIPLGGNLLQLNKMWFVLPWCNS